MATNSDEEDEIQSITNDQDGQERSGSPLSALSLDVLAQVASDRLQTDNAKIIKRGNRLPLKIKKKNYTTKRNLQSFDALDLTQIPTLSDKLLLNMYSEMSSDEIRKVYTFSCRLEPGDCTHQVSVYGNEMKAKTEMKYHLRQHIKELLDKYKDNPEDFSSETTPGRKKRLQSEHNKQVRMKRKLKRDPLPALANTFNGIRRRGRPPNFPQTLHDYAGLGVNIDKGLLEKDAQKKHRIEKFRMDVIEKYLSPDENEEDENRNEEQIKREEGDSMESDYAEQDKENTDESQEQAAEAADLASSKSTSDSKEDPQEEGPREEPSQEDLDKEQLIIDLMSKSQPYQDHNYTSILGKKRGIETLQHECDSEEEEEELKEELMGNACSRTVGKRLGKPHHIVFSAESRPGITLTLDTKSLNEASAQTFPVVKMPPLPIVTDGIAGTGRNYALLSREIVAWEELKRLASKMTQKRSAYPPMPQANLDKQGRIPEENLLGATPSSDQEEEAPKEFRKIVNPFKRGRRGFDTMGGEWERKMALKCIRELRSASKKKEETILVCKICKSRTFTATATLMYHYRSHAGIKPFVCLICNTTFTRQHSLNYHMLIHNNQSRFSCRECGRKFRHPSHFKEHMRRHTGETPYHCTDCPLRFKTRNTYKRHLRTRHDKVLTSVGIKNMSTEDAERFKAMVKVEPPDRDSEGIEDDQGEPLPKTTRKIKDIIKFDTTAKGYPKIIKTEIGSGFTQTSVQVSVANTPQANKLSGIQTMIPIQPVKPAIALQPLKPAENVQTPITNATANAATMATTLQSVQISSAATTAPTQVFTSSAGGTFHLQLPNTQTFNISGLQLQLPGQQIQVPVTMVQPSTHIQLPFLQAANSNLRGSQVGATQFQMPIIHAAAQTGQPIQVPFLQTPSIAGQAGSQIQLPIVQAQSLAGQAASQIQVPIVQSQTMSGQSATQIQVPLLQAQALNGPTGSQTIQMPFQSPPVCSQAGQQIHLVQPQGLSAQYGTKIQLPLIQAQTVANSSSKILPRLQIPLIRPQAILTEQQPGVQQGTVAQFTQMNPATPGATQLLITPAYTQSNTHQTGYISLPVNQGTFQLGAFNSAGSIQQLGTINQAAGSLQTVPTLTTGFSYVPISTAGGAVNLTQVTNSPSYINITPTSPSQSSNNTNNIYSVATSMHLSIPHTSTALQQQSQHQQHATTAPNTPAANTLLRFCTAVANQAGQVASNSNT